MFKFGIEHEVAFLRGEDFADFSNTRFEEFQAVIDRLPRYEEDYPALRVGDMGIKAKRWYIEGYERFHKDGSFLECVPKGIEIRTVPRATIKETLAELQQSYSVLIQHLKGTPFSPTWVSFNPFRTEFVPNPPLNSFEISMRSESPEAQTAQLPMVTYGPDLNISYSELSRDALIDIGKKLTHYSPFIVPFSFSSPFYKGSLWEGFSVRTYLRTGVRPAVMVFVSDPQQVIKLNPTLTEIARIPAEVGRIEFKAFDTCNDLKLYARFA